MQKDFHYYMTLALAINAGIDLDAATEIAWSNQFTDECKDFDKYGIRTMVDIAWKTSDCFVPEVQRSVFVPFHFLPGDNNLFPFIVTPASGLANTLIAEAIQTLDPVRLGVALHGYQDTFSHQGFTGMQDDINAKHQWDLTTLIAPRIGHAEHGHDPDMIGRVWNKSQEIEVNNTQRFKQAALETYKILKIFKGDVIELDSEIDSYLESVLADFWKIKNYDKRKEWLLHWAGLDALRMYKYCIPTKKMIERFVAAARKQQSIVAEYISQFK